MKYQGKIFNWNDERGFGFVEPNGGGERAFVHVKAFTRLTKRPIDGNLIVYEVTTQQDGRLKASNIRFASDKRVFKKRSSLNPLATLVAVGFCLALPLLIGLGRMPTQIGMVYVAMSIVAYALYAWDKSAAKNNEWRTKERTLHMIGLLGGWPGALLAQRQLRHKSSKAEFKLVYWVTVTLNLVAFGWLLSPRGRQFLDSVTGQLNLAGF